MRAWTRAVPVRGGQPCAAARLLPVRLGAQARRFVVHGEGARTERAADRSRRIGEDRTLLRLPAVPGQSLAFALAEALGRAIVCGRFDDGGFPIEAELGRRYGASRSIVREVVKMLTAKGLLGSRPRVGTIVQPSSNWHLLDPDVLRWLLDRRASPELMRALTQMRLAFEPEAGALASRQAPADAVRRAVERLDAAAAGAGDPTAAEVAFHLAVLEAASNPFFAQLKPVVATAATLSARVTRQIPGSVASLQARRLAAEAILSGDPAAARDRLRSLLRDEAERIGGFVRVGR